MTFSSALMVEVGSDQCWRCLSLDESIASLLLLPPRKLCTSAINLRIPSTSWKPHHAMPCAALPVPSLARPGGEPPLAASPDEKEQGFIRSAQTPRPTRVCHEPSNSGLTIWPNRQFRYRYENAAAKEALDTDVLDAWQIWLTHGLSESFTIKEVDEEKCVRSRFENLLIGVNNEASLMTLVGAIGADSKIRTSKSEIVTKDRPFMLISTSTSIGMLNTAFNIAHEWVTPGGFTTSTRTPTSGEA